MVEPGAVLFKCPKTDISPRCMINWTMVELGAVLFKCPRTDISPRCMINWTMVELGAVLFKCPSTDISPVFDKLNNDRAVLDDTLVQ